MEESNKHLEGFKISIDILDAFLRNGLDGLDVKPLLTLKHEDILRILQIGKERIKKEIEDNKK